MFNFTYSQIMCYLWIWAWVIPCHNKGRAYNRIRWWKKNKMEKYRLTPSLLDLYYVKDKTDQFYPRVSVSTVGYIDIWHYAGNKTQYYQTCSLWDTFQLLSIELFCLLAFSTIYKRLKTRWLPNFKKNAYKI